MLDLIQSIEAEKISLDEVNKLSDEDREEKLNLVSIKRNKVKSQSRAFLNSQPPENSMNEVGAPFPDQLRMFSLIYVLKNIS